MKQNDLDRLNYKLHKMYGPEDRHLPGRYIPRKMPELKENWFKAIIQSIRNFFSFKSF